MIGRNPDGTVDVMVSGVMIESPTARAAMGKDFTHGRHLYESGSESTICGLRIGTCVWHQLGRVAVHKSKARKDDCPVCRHELRRELWERREYWAREDRRQARLAAKAALTREEERAAAPLTIE